jgi:RNA polymerase sigma-70 factor (ECF subfamily)
VPGLRECTESDWVRGRAHRAIEELPDDQRRLIELAYWSALSQSEIATRLHISRGTVKALMRDALTRLAEVLERQELR